MHEDLVALLVYYQSQALEFSRIANQKIASGESEESVDEAFAIMHDYEYVVLRVEKASKNGLKYVERFARILRNQLFRPENYSFSDVRNPLLSEMANELQAIVKKIGRGDEDA